MLNKNTYKGLKVYLKGYGKKVYSLLKEFTVEG